MIFVDIQHNLMLLALDGKLHVAPIEDMAGGLHNVLDVATGTGNWAIDFGEPKSTDFLISECLQANWNPSKRISIRERCRNRLESHASRIVRHFPPHSTQH